MKETIGLKKLFNAIFINGNVEFDKFDFNQWVKWALDTLEEREKCVIEKRFFLNKTFKETGKLIVNLGPDIFKSFSKNRCDGVGPQRASQIEAKALRKLRHPSRTRKYINKKEVYGAYP